MAGVLIELTGIGALSMMYVQFVAHFPTPSYVKSVVKFTYLGNGVSVRTLVKISKVV